MPFLPKVNGKLLGFAPGFLLYAVILPVALPPFETLERGTYYAYFNRISIILSIVVWCGPENLVLFVKIKSECWSVFGLYIAA